LIAWVNQRGKEWGRWRQRHEDGWPKSSLMSRIKEEGAVGAAIKQTTQHIPIKTMPKEIADFHRAWLTMDEIPRAVVEVIYRSSATRDEKADALGMSKSRMYQWLEQAHGYLAGRLDVLPESRLSNLSTFDRARSSI
jgi:DNA-directed RNA polymerase specialized sigma subunit